MNKNIKKMTAAMLAIGCLTVGGLGGVAFAAGNSYDNFKAAVVETMNQDNMTFISSVQMKQEGVVFAQSDMITQIAGNTSYSRANTIINDIIIVTEQSEQNGIIISRQGEDYSSINYGASNSDRQNIQNSPNLVKFIEMTSDLLIGDVKNQFSQDGDKITVNLTGAQIPELANVAIAAFTEMGVNSQNGNYDMALSNAFPITQNGVIKSVQVIATVKDGSISDIDLDIQLTGQDKSGNTIMVETTISGTVSEIGTTVANQIDTVGKTVKEQNFDFKN